MEIEAAVVKQMSAATSPEEAYKIFAGAVSEGLGQLVADALAKAMGGAAKGVKSPSTKGWQDFVKGMNIQAHWGTPGFQLPPTVKNTFAAARVTNEADPAAKGFTVQVGGSWSF